MGGDVQAHGDHGHHGIPKIPDYRIYKVEDVPRLVRAQKILASKGLRDPWLRNEVWKFCLEKETTTMQRFWRFWKRGMMPGLALAVAAVGLEQAWKFATGGDIKHHGEHHGEHH
ncbi:unnamed protein product [Ixodes pacificus]